MMPKALTSAAVGALVRQARIDAGLSQTELGRRIGASRFWVAQLEKGKPGAELGRALKAIDTLGLTVHIEPAKAAIGKTSQTHVARPKADAKGDRTKLAGIIAHTTVSRTAKSSVIGWPTASAPSRPSGKPTPRARG